MSKSKEPEAVAPAVSSAPPLGSAGRNNIWRYKVLGADGKHVATDASGTVGSITVKGPPSVPELLRSAEMMLNSKRGAAVASGLDDPGYRIDPASIEALGHTDDDVGVWRPAGANPLSLPTDPAVKEADMKMIRERVGAREVLPE